VSSSIGPGENEVISLGLELSALRLIVDERPARRLAASLGLAVIGTIGLLLAAKDRGLLAKIRPDWIASWPPVFSWTRNSMTEPSAKPQSEFNNPPN
jgi:hypothetical protein